jgi:hypothetical protein
MRVVREFTFSSGSRIEGLTWLVLTRSMVLQQRAAALRKRHQCGSVVVAIERGDRSQQPSASKPAQFVLGGRCRPLTWVPQIIDWYDAKGTH